MRTTGYIASLPGAAILSLVVLTTACQPVAPYNNARPIDSPVQEKWPVAILEPFATGPVTTLMNHLLPFALIAAMIIAVCLTAPEPIWTPFPSQGG